MSYECTFRLVRIMTKIVFHLSEACAAICLGPLCHNTANIQTLAGAYLPITKTAPVSADLLKLLTARRTLSVQGTARRCAPSLPVPHALCRTHSRAPGRSKSRSRRSTSAGGAQSGSVRLGVVHHGITGLQGRQGKGGDGEWAPRPDEPGRADGGKPKLREPKTIVCFS